MTLTVLSVAYPFAPVAPETAGGAEQVLLTLDRKLVAAGHRSIVLAQRGSHVAGTLIPMPAAPDRLDERTRAQSHEAWRRTLAGVIEADKIDIVHMHGVDFDAYLPSCGPPVLVTLHLPISWYPAAYLRRARTEVYFNCVSARQNKDARGMANLLPAIENGVDIDAFSAVRARRRSFAVMLARICPEKGVHLALEAARLANCPLLIAGRVFPYDDHKRYFEREIEPRLDARRRFIVQIGSSAKRRLLGAARCVLIASTVPETSSLVAREALAAGAPVIAFRNGALVDVVDDGRTGFLVESVEEMADAIGRAKEINSDDCRSAARRRFSAEPMFEAYVETYARLVARRQRAQIDNCAEQDEVS